MKTKIRSAGLSRPEKLVRRNAADIQAYTKTLQYKKDVARVKAITDDQIDFSDMPELTDKELASMRPAKIQRTIRLDADVLRWLQLKPGAYQTRLNAILRAVMLRETKPG